MKWEVFELELSVIFYYKVITKTLTEWPSLYYTTSITLLLWRHRWNKRDVVTIKHCLSNNVTVFFFNITKYSFYKKECSKNNKNQILNLPAVRYKVFNLYFSISFSLSVVVNIIFWVNVFPLLNDLFLCSFYINDIYLCLHCKFVRLWFHQFHYSAYINILYMLSNTLLLYLYWLCHSLRTQK